MQSTHMDYIIATANLRACMYGVAGSTNKSDITAALDSFEVPSFTPRSGVKIGKSLMVYSRPDTVSKI